MEDYQITERCGAYGAFTLTNDLTPYTQATLFRQVGKKTHVLLTFSEVHRWEAGSESYGRTCACSIKFYTADGIWNLVGCYRHLHGFGCRTYRFVNSRDQRLLVKFHFLSQQDFSASAGGEPGRKYTDYLKWARHDLHDSIRKGNYPRWKLCLQMMPREDAATCSFNPYDPTMTWPREDYPLMEAGILELNCNPQNDAHEIRHCHFNPFNLVPGIELPALTPSTSAKEQLTELK